ncbi:sensor histidine kinase [Desulfurobacterium atlanticum]|uniref:GHKL domain-containing protein n=1 Tax=Desulfurobacterium atlanticum TaxID=240169 RepID=A0A238ZS77_9BACT|nr:HAMP domain-containing sensor histidine kinase [Desulfurobacterium atlanticum]SNR86155.1 GHKL domain-containing protein [Desulfurobacterium atlanticum]
MEYRSRLKIVVPVILTLTLMGVFSFNFYRLKTEWENFFTSTINNELKRVKSMVESTVESGGDPVSSLSSYMENSSLLKGAKIKLYDRTVKVPGSNFEKNFMERKIDFKNFSVILYFDISKEKEINTHILNQFLIATAISIALIAGIFLSLKLYFDERESLSRETAEKERLKSISIAISSILHEVKNSLSRLNMIAYRIATKKDLKYAEILQKEVQQLSKFIDEAAALNKPLKLNVKKLNIKDIIDEAVKEFKELTSLKGIEIICKAENIFTKGDKNLLKSALRNIIKNGIEALDVSNKKEKKLIIETKKGKNSLKIIIKDNANIPWKEDELFSPFKTTKEKGFGIGLFSVKRIIKAHNGTVKAYKSKGYSVFEITIPITTASS